MDFLEKPCKYCDKCHIDISQSNNIINKKYLPLFLELNNKLKEMFKEYNTLHDTINLQELVNIEDMLNKDTIIKKEIENIQKQYTILTEEFRKEKTTLRRTHLKGIIDTISLLEKKRDENVAKLAQLEKTLEGQKKLVKQINNELLEEKMIYMEHNKALSPTTEEKAYTNTIVYIKDHN